MSLSLIVPKQFVLPRETEAGPGGKGRFGSFEQDNCAICLGGLSRPVELACGHCFCAFRANHIPHGLGPLATST